MANDIAAAWEQFRSINKPSGLSLNPICPPEQIQFFEKQHHFELPSALKTLLGMNDGQQVGAGYRKNGLFKSVSGWDVYERHLLLGIDGIAAAYAAFLGEPVLLSEFGPEEIPFAVAGSPARYQEAFCINRRSGAISLIWTETGDPFNPSEWQVQKFHRGASLAEFIELQISLYR